MGTPMPQVIAKTIKGDIEGRANSGRAGRERCLEGYAKGAPGFWDDYGQGVVNCT